MMRAKKSFCTQRAFLKNLNKCGDNKECIKEILNKRTFAIRGLKSSDKNNPNPYFMTEEIISLKNGEGKCLGGTICEISIIGFGNGASQGCNIGVQGSFGYIDKFGIALYGGFEGLNVKKISKSQAMREIPFVDSIEEFESGDFHGASSAIKVLKFDDDFILFGIEGEGCGAYCTQFSSEKYFEIETLQVANLDSKKLLAKFINDDFCSKGFDKKDNYSANDNPKQCYKSIKEAEQYFFSSQFRNAFGSKPIYLKSVDLWFDTHKGKLLTSEEFENLITDTPALRAMLTKAMEREFCPENKEDYNDDEYPICKMGDEAQECYFGHDDFNEVCGLLKKQVNFEKNSLAMEFNFPHVIRSQNTIIYFDYEILKPYAKGTLKQIIESNGG
ncbi:hypothetical protein CQA53_01830 [Helicobacter didelphidarum]|uniref:Uncharacterized protein n=1 Tax=Helicobacter didelphidarum TaxID=2040648 RepID=A0A3D8IP10_9HELI|nr:hypothetical protein [Helicobacter didelphidarum]RDU67027.1 hypothetical protein CQA53_01830 [Helicobacter didelphidarum]